MLGFVSNRNCSNQSQVENANRVAHKMPNICPGATLGKLRPGQDYLSLIWTVVWQRGKSLRGSSEFSSKLNLKRTLMLHMSVATRSSKRWIAASTISSSLLGRYQLPIWASHQRCCKRCSHVTKQPRNNPYEQPGSSSRGCKSH